MEKGKEIEKIINHAVSTAVEATMKSISQKPKNIYKQTESKLYAYPTLVKNIKRYELDIADLKREKITEKSKDITSYSECGGIRLTPEEKQAAKILAVQMKKSRDEAEVKEIQIALGEISEDVYYRIIELRYFNNLADEDIAEALNCEKTTVWRNRARLVKKLSVIFFGADAI